MFSWNLWARDFLVIWEWSPLSLPLYPRPSGRWLPWFYVDAVSLFAGLQLYLQSHRNNILPLYGMQTGARVVIHDARSMPFARERGLHMRPGNMYYARVQRTVLQRIGHPWGTCARDGDNTTTSYLSKPYSQIVSAYNSLLVCLTKDKYRSIRSSLCNTFCKASINCCSRFAPF